MFIYIVQIIFLNFCFVTYLYDSSSLSSIQIPSMEDTLFQQKLYFFQILSLKCFQKMLFKKCINDGCLYCRLIDVIMEQIILHVTKTILNAHINELY